MPTIIDKLLNRDTETKPSAEELRQIADLAQEETTRLAQLIDQARRELEAKAGMQESIKSVESRISVCGWHSASVRTTRYSSARND